MKIFIKKCLYTKNIKLLLEGDKMNAGKLDWDDLKKIIEDNRGVHREDVVVRSGIGEDCSVINFGDYECVLSTDPITGAEKNIGRLAVNINCNDIASAGVSPVGIMVTILAPVGCELEQIKKVMHEISIEAEKYNIEILGGHTEVTEAVNKLIVSCTVVGRCRAGRAISTKGARIGDDIIVTKFLGMEGTSILLNDYYKYIAPIISEEEKAEIKSYEENLSVIKEGIIAGKFGVHSMHDITEGGVLGALWEVAESSRLGFAVYEDRMPVSCITRKICDKLQIDPLRLISSGSMLITTECGEKLIALLEKEGVSGVIIGKITEGKGIIISESGNLEVTPPDRDELFKFFERTKLNN